MPNSHRSPFPLRVKLTLSYLIVGGVITLATLYCSRAMQQRNAAEAASRAATTRMAMTLASVVNSAFEEGYSYVLSKDPGEKRNFFQRIETFRQSRRGLEVDPNVEPELALALDQTEEPLDAAVAGAVLMFEDAEDDGHVEPESYTKYEAGMDEVLVKVEAFAAVERRIDERHLADAKRVADRALVAIGALAALLAAMMGTLLGGRLTRPLYALRDAAIGFARGNRQIAFPVTSEDEIGELAGAIGDMAVNVRELLGTVDRQKTHLDNVFTSMREMLFVCAPDGTIVSANRSACIAMGFDEGEIVGTSLFERVVMDTATTWRPPGGMAAGDVMMRTKSGREFPAAISNSALSGTAPHEPGGFVCVAQDLTERCRLEADLRQGQRLESLGRFTAGIAHEMGSPLAAVRASLMTAKELICEYASSAGDATVTPADHALIAKELEEVVTLADSGAERVCGFVRSIRAQTRGTTDVRRTRFNAVTAVRDALSLVGHAAIQGGTELSFRTDVANGDLDGDPGRVGQVVTNLVGNAIDANAERGGGHVEIELARTSGEFVLTVTDDGPGIPDALLQRIFEPLFTTKAIGKGTGLGLAIVHDIVKGDFGGSISVKNRVQGGAMFSVHIPHHMELVA